MMCYIERMIKRFTPGLLLLSLPLAAAPAYPSEQSNADGPADYLEMYKEFDGRCQGLRRGDIRMIRNTHPSRSIEFRMVRMLGDKRQASLIRDTIKPRDEGQRLGCEILDGREQTWKIIRARFVD